MTLLLFMKKKYKYGLNVMNSAKKFQKGSVKMKNKTDLSIFFTAFFCEKRHCKSFIFLHFVT